MNCNSVRTRLAGYLDDGLTGSNRLQERARVREHLESCADCREDLQRFRKLGVLLSTVRKHTPPPDLSVRIKLAAAPRYCSTMFFVHSPCRPPADLSLPSWFSSWFFRSSRRALPCVP